MSRARRILFQAEVLIPALGLLCASGCIPINVAQVRRNMETLPPHVTAEEAMCELKQHWFEISDDSPRPRPGGYEIFADRRAWYWLLPPIGQRVLVIVELDQTRKVTAVIVREFSELL